MSTADLIAAAPVLDAAPAWAGEGISFRASDPIDAAPARAAQIMDQAAADKGFTIGEVARVVRQSINVFYARAAVSPAAAPAPSPSAALLKSQEFGGFLDKAITENKSQAMNKFAELAAKIKANQAAMEAEADHLSVEADKTMSLFMAATTRHRSMLDMAKEGVKAMEEAAASMVGHNEEPK
jgi:hypothetical protein